jgi:hypothetical protein
MVLPSAKQARYAGSSRRIGINFVELGAGVAARDPHGVRDQVRHGEHRRSGFNVNPSSCNTPARPPGSCFRSRTVTSYPGPVR